jgi:hypothetical protein
MINAMYPRSATLAAGLVIAMLTTGCVTKSVVPPAETVSDPAMAPTVEAAAASVVAVVGDIAEVIPGEEVASAQAERHEALPQDVAEVTPAVEALSAAEALPVAQVSDPAETPADTHYVLAKPVRADLPAVAGAAKTREPQAAPAASSAMQVAVAAPPETAEEPALDPGLLSNEVLAEVDGKVITREDILGPMRAELAQWRKECSDEAFESRCRAAVDFRLSRIVSQRLLVQEAKARLSAKEQADLLAAAGDGVAGPAALLVDFTGTAAPASLGKIAEPKMAPADWMLVQGYLRETLGPRVRVTQSELLKYYNEVAADRYTLVTKVRLGVIVIRKCDSATPQWAESLAKAVLSRVTTGEDFAAVARRFSRDASAPAGGDAGFITQGSYPVKAVEDVLFALPVGALSPLVETPEAFYIVKSLERLDGRTVPFAEVQSALEQEIRDRKYTALVAGYVRDLYKRWSDQYKTAAASL